MRGHVRHHSPSGDIPGQIITLDDDNETSMQLSEILDMDDSIGSIGGSTQNSRNANYPPANRWVEGGGGGGDHTQR